MTLSILHLTNHCEGGGNVHLAVDLACAQAANGERVVFASGGGRYVEFLERHGVRHVLVNQSLRAPWQAARGAAALLGQCRSYPPDVIHAHMMSGAVLGKIASRLIGVPLVTTMHNSFDPHSGLMRLGDVIAAISEAERDAILARGVPARRVRVILNGTIGSPRTEASTQSSLKLQRPCITTLCGLEKRKGVHDVIDAFALIAGQVPQWRLVIAGDGPERQALTHQAMATGFGDRIDFIGHVNAPMGILSQSDLFVQASYAEPFGLSILEARDAGCAVVGTRVGGIAEQLGDGRFGATVPPGRPDLLAEEFQRLMTNPEALRDAQGRARQDLTIYRVERMARDYSELYRAAMAAHGSTRRDGPDPSAA